MKPSFLHVKLLLISAAASAQAASITWDNGSGDKLWSTVNNWSDNAAATGDDITFNTTGTAASGTVTNIVDASISINSLAFTNIGGTATMHTTQINSGQTLTIAGSTGTVFSLLPGSGNTSNVVIKGDSSGVGTLEITGGTGDFRVASPPTNSTQTATLDMSGLGTFTASVTNFKVADLSGITSAVGTPTGTVTLAVTNTITATTLGVGYNTLNNATGGSGTLILGTTNTINADTINIGRGKASGTVQMVAGGGGGSGTTAIIRNTAGTGAVTTLNLGVGNTNTSTNNNSILDFGSTTLDAQFATINMGQGAASANTAKATGVLTFGAGTLTATTVNLGLGAVSSNSAASGSGTINQNGGTANLTTVTIGKNSGTAATTTSGTYNLAGGILKATTIQAGTVAGSGAATRTINWTGGTIQNLSGGDLTIGAGIDIKMDGTNTFYADASRTITVNTALGFTGGITGTLVKDGAGTLTLTGTNSYTGNTNVNQGTLVINGSISTSLLTTVQSGATLGGSGTVGVATVDGILAPGNSIGTLTATGDVTWNDNDAWIFELGVASLNLAAASGGSENDLLNITGAGSDFLKGTGSSFTFDFANTGAVGWYKLVDWTGTTNFVGTDFSTTGLTSGLTGTFTVDSGTSALYLNIVPEPSAALLGTLGLLGLLRRRR